MHDTSDIATTECRSETSMSRELDDFLAGRVCVLGIGNRDRCDDGVGSLIAERLAGRISAPTFDAGAVPENYLEKVARLRPDTILIVDAADFGGAPGEIRVLDTNTVAPAALSTHALSLRMAAQFLKARTGARLALLAIQPADIGPGAHLSDAVSRAVGVIERTLVTVLPVNMSEEADHA